MIFDYPRKTRTGNGLPATVFSFELFLRNKLVKGENIPKALFTKMGSDFFLPVVEVEIGHEKITLLYKSSDVPTVKAALNLLQNMNMATERASLFIHKEVVYSSKEPFSCLLRFAVKKALAPSVAVLLAPIKTDQKG